MCLQGKVELLAAMRELGCDYRGAFVGRTDHTGELQEYLDIRVSRVYKHLHKKGGVKVTDVVAQFRADHAAGLLYWDTEPTTLANGKVHRQDQGFVEFARKMTVGQAAAEMDMDDAGEVMLRAAASVLAKERGAKMAAAVGARQPALVKVELPPSARNPHQRVAPRSHLQSSNPLVELMVL